MADAFDLREARKRIRLLEQEGGRVFVAGVAPKMIVPLVRGLAVDRVPVAVTCRVLGFSKQAFFVWQKTPVSQQDWDNAHLTNAAVDLHRYEPAFGYRFISEEIEAESGLSASERRVWRLCSEQRLWSVFSKKRGVNREAGPPVQDDLVLRDFTADTLDQLWLVDITEHWTDEGKLYLCAIKNGQFQETSTTSSFGGCRDGFFERPVHRIFDVSRGCDGCAQSRPYPRSLGQSLRSICGVRGRVPSPERIRRERRRGEGVSPLV